MKPPRPLDPWSVAALLCLFGGAVLLVVAWYDVSGTANVYEQLPYLVSAGFTGLALIIVGSALLAAGRTDRVERRLAQLIDAITEAGASDGPAVQTTQATVSDPASAAAATFLSVPGSTTFHRPQCLLLRDKAATAVSPGDIQAAGLIPCPVCEPVL